MASVVSASSAGISSPARSSPARERTDTRRQRLVAERGRDSSLRTVSPICASLASSCAANSVEARMTRLYSRWRVRRSTDTTIVLSILSLTTRPTLVFRCPCTGVVAPVVAIPAPLPGRPSGGPRALHGEDPGDLLAGRRDLAVVLQLAGREGEPRLPEVLLGLLEPVVQLSVGELPDLSDLHRRPPSRC